MAVSLSLGLLSVQPIPIEAQPPAQLTDPQAVLATMTLDHKVGQMFMASIFGEGLPEPNEVFLRAMQPGAIAAFSSNVNTPQRTTTTTNAWQALAVQIGAKIPLIIAIDHEGGPVTRLLPEQGYTPLPWGAALGAMTQEMASKVGAMAAEELSAIGIRMNLAPVVDVRVRNDPPFFVERRTFGPDPVRVSAGAVAYVNGLQSGGVAATLKHFPGHGAAGDSHNFLPVVSRDLNQIELVDLAPYVAGIQAGVDAIMVGHLSVPVLDATPNLPTSLSHPVVTGLLRQKLGFEGVILTDALDMGAIVDTFTPPVAAVMAVQAGIDMLATGPKMPLTQQLAMKQAIIDAVAAGQITEDRIDASVLRILRLKAKYGLLTWSPLDARTADQRVRVAAHTEMLDEIYLDTVAVSNDYASLLPLNPAQTKVALVIPGIYPAVGRACESVARAARVYAYSQRPTDSEVLTVAQMADQFDVVVVFTYNMQDNPRQALLVNALPPERTVVVALQSPYDFEAGIVPSAYMAAFNTHPAAFRAACAVLYGKHDPAGRFTADVG